MTKFRIEWAKKNNDAEAINRLYTNVYRGTHITLKKRWDAVGLYCYEHSKMSIIEIFTATSIYDDQKTAFNKFQCFQQHVHQWDTITNKNSWMSYFIHMNTKEVYYYEETILDYYMSMTCALNSNGVIR